MTSIVRSRGRSAIATKMVAGRRKDREDVRGMLADAAVTIDLDALRRVLVEFDEALDEPRAVKRFETLYRAHQKRAAK